MQAFILSKWGHCNFWGGGGLVLSGPVGSYLYSADSYGEERTTRSVAEALELIFGKDKVPWMDS